jgi:hypothetical protein
MMAFRGGARGPQRYERGECPSSGSRSGSFVFVAGFISLTKLNIEAYPDPVPPRVEIITQNPGQSAEEIDKDSTARHDLRPR